MFGEPIVGIDGAEGGVGERASLNKGRVIGCTADFDIIIAGNDVLVRVSGERVCVGHFGVWNEAGVWSRSRDHFAAFCKADDNIIDVEAFKSVVDTTVRDRTAWVYAIVVTTELIPGQEGRVPHWARIRDVVPDDADDVATAFDIESGNDKRLSGNVVSCMGFD